MSDLADLRIMGVTIGKATSSEYQDTLQILFMDFRRNALGERFIPNFEDSNDLSLDFDRGLAIEYNREGKATILKADWGVFNKTHT